MCSRPWFILLQTLSGAVLGCAKNQPPVLQPPDAVEIGVGEAMTVVLDAADPDGDALAFAIDRGPEGATIDGEVLSWSPTEANIGTNLFQVTVTDDGSPPLTDTTSFLATVTPHPNRAPVAESVDDVETWVGATLTLALAATDPDGDTLSWSSPDPLPGNATLDPSGVFRFVPRWSDRGPHTLTFVVTDDGAPPLADQLELNILVTVPTFCYQQAAVDNGQVELIEDSTLTIDVNYAVTTSAPAPATALPAGLDEVDYYGAVDPAATGDVWWQGWTVGGNYDGTLSTIAFHPLDAEIVSGEIVGAPENSCTDIDANFVDGGVISWNGYPFPVCLVNERITTSQTWTNDHFYVLTDTVTVGTGDHRLEGRNPVSNAFLTIERGTQVFGLAHEKTSLTISRGSEIIAVGDVDYPIVFSAIEQGPSTWGDPMDVYRRGQWGGVILSGFGETNAGDANAELLTEMVPPDRQRWFGGTDDADSSGILEYVVIAESGGEFRPDEEVQGLTLEAAGSGTSIDFIQVLGGEDDCVEWFGGAASIRHIVNNGCDDDGWDQDLGWRGTLQYGIHKHGAQNGHRGIESDNNGSNFDAVPQTAPIIANVTLIGDHGTGDSSAALHREGWRGRVFRSVYTDGEEAWFRGCLDIDDILPAELEYRDVVVNCSNGALLECDE